MLRGKKGRPATRPEAATATTVRRGASGARDAALKYLTPRARTVHEVKQKLRRQGYGEDEVAATLEVLVGQGLLDDAAYARQLIESRLRSRPSGSRALLAELTRRGVEAECARQVLADYTGQLDTAATAAAALRRQAYRYVELDAAVARRRMLALLARRGFGPDVASRAVDTVWEDWRQNAS